MLKITDIEVKDKLTIYLEGNKYINIAMFGKEPFIGSDLSAGIKKSCQNLIEIKKTFKEKDLEKLRKFIGTEIQEL